jgi:hypothetical protein
VVFNLDVGAPLSELRRLMQRGPLRGVAHFPSHTGPLNKLTPPWLFWDPCVLDTYRHAALNSLPGLTSSVACFLMNVGERLRLHFRMCPVS